MQNRTVPRWIERVLEFVLAGTFAKSLRDPSLVGNPTLVVAQVLGSLIGLIGIWFAVHWILGWCFAFVRKNVRIVDPDLQINNSVSVLGKDKPNRTVPLWIDIALGVLMGISYERFVTRADQLITGPDVHASYVLGGLLGVAVLWRVVYWSIRWYYRRT